MLFVFLLNCGGRRIGGRPTKIVISFEQHPCPIVGAYSNRCLDSAKNAYRSVANNFVISLFSGMGPLLRLTGLEQPKIKYGFGDPPPPYSWFYDIAGITACTMR